MPVSELYEMKAVFERIEDELLNSMIRNLKRHKVEETKTGYNWSMWQAEQLKALRKYQKRNDRKYGKLFKHINSKIKKLILLCRQEGQTRQELEILSAIEHGFRAQKASASVSGAFFRLNDKKLDALINAVENDMKNAQVAVLRRAEDQYRQIIYTADVYANTGAGTYEKAVDMAVKDFAGHGIDCIMYKDGSRHAISDYADMAIRTAGKRAYLYGEGEKRQEWGIHTVIVNKRGNPCPKCLPHCGKVYIDDVWSGGTEADGDYPLLSSAVKGGLYHPRCKDSHTTYFYGISTPPTGVYKKGEIEAIKQQNKAEHTRQYKERQRRKYKRLADNALDAENKKKYLLLVKKYTED